MTLIDVILDKNDKSPKGRNGQLKGRKSLKLMQADYDRIGKPELIAEAMQLEAEELIQVSWYDGKSEILNIRYDVKALPVLYDKAGREPPWNCLSRYRKRVLEGMGRLTKEWVKAYYLTLLRLLDRGSIPDNLKREGFLECMEALDQLEEPVYKRVFSARYLSDSKAFEDHLQKRIVTIAKKYCPDVDDNMDESQILSQIYIEEYAQQLYVKGRLLLQLHKNEIDLSLFPYGAALNSQTLRHAKISKKQVIKKVVTIENQANFESASYEEDVLYIFSHGYFSPKECDFLRKLAMVLEGRGVSYFHTGDLDFGGVRIFQYIRNLVFPELLPLNMGKEQYLRYKQLGYGRKIKPQTLKKLMKINEPLLKPLIDIMYLEGWGIEQECFL